MLVGTADMASSSPSEARDLLIRVSMIAEQVPRFARDEVLLSRQAAYGKRTRVLAYTNRPLYPNGDAAAQGKIRKLLISLAWSG